MYATSRARGMKATAPSAGMASYGDAPRAKWNQYVAQPPGNV